MAEQGFKTFADMVTAFGQSPVFWPPVAELRAEVGDRFDAMPPKAQLVRW